MSFHTSRTVTLLPFTMPKFTAAASDAQFYKELFAVSDTHFSVEEANAEINSPEERKERFILAAKKKQIELERLLVIQQQIGMPGFRLIEFLMLSRSKEIERSEIWDALKKGDRAIYQLQVEHDGIISFFDKFKNISENVNRLKKELAEFGRAIKEDNFPESSIDPRDELNK